MLSQIRSFRNHLRPLIIIDGAHLKSDIYHGVNLLAVGMDGNNQILPIAYGICQGEDGPGWTWFLEQLKLCIGEDRKLTIISDRHPGIIKAVKKVYPKAFHGYCCRHLMMNAGIKAEIMKPIFWKMCKAYTIPEFDCFLEMIRVAKPNAFKKLTAAQYSKWSRAHCVDDRYNYLTSNSAESVNSLSRKARKLPVTMFMEFYRDLLQRWYFERKETGGISFNIIKKIYYYKKYLCKHFFNM